MAATAKRWWRRHPILFAAILGAALGLLNTFAVELGGVYHHDRHRGILAFGPGSPFGLGVSETALVQTGAILFIEFAANILVLAALFAAPVAAVVAVRRVIAKSRTHAGQS